MSSLVDWAGDLGREFRAALFFYPGRWPALNIRLRWALALRYRGNYTQREIAQALGITGMRVHVLEALGLRRMGIEDGHLKRPWEDWEAYGNE